MNSSTHVTVEKTSKNLKLRLVMSWIACIGGFTISFLLFKMSSESKELGCYSGSYSKAATVFLIVAFLGLVNVFITKLKIWWNHG